MKLLLPAKLRTLSTNEANLTLEKPTRGLHQELTPRVVPEGCDYGAANVLLVAMPVCRGIHSDVTPQFLGEGPPLTVRRA